jgi:hypothetical protein
VQGVCDAALTVSTLFLSLSFLAEPHANGRIKFVTADTKLVQTLTSQKSVLGNTPFAAALGAVAVILEKGTDVSRQVSEPSISGTVRND